jgi:hypothetical protein
MEFDAYCKLPGRTTCARYATSADRVDVFARRYDTVEAALLTIVTANERHSCLKQRDPGVPAHPMSSSRPAHACACGCGGSGAAAWSTRGAVNAQN